MFFESLKERTSLSSIGAQLRMVSCFSLNTSVKFLLPGFTFNQQGLLSYFRRFYEEDADPSEEPDAVIDGAAAEAQYTEELRRLKRGCICIALAAKLLTLWLRNEMMLYMKVIDAHWLSFGTLASFVLRESLINVMQTTTTLKTLGVAIGGNCGEENALQEQRDRCSRLLEQRWQSTGFAPITCENTTHRTPCGLPSSFPTAWSNNKVQPCEVSEKISIFSCKWKSAPEAMTG